MRNEFCYKKDDTLGISAEVIAQRICDESYARGWTMNKYTVDDIEPIIEDYLNDGWTVNETYLKILSDLRDCPLTT